MENKEKKKKRTVKVVKKTVKAWAIVWKGGTGIHDARNAPEAHMRTMRIFHARKFANDYLSKGLMLKIVPCTITYSLKK